MDKSLETYTLPKLKEEEIENLNRPITSKDIESVIKNFPRKRAQGQMAFQGNSTKHLMKSYTYALEAVPKKEMEGKLPNVFSEPSITLIPKPEKYPLNMDTKIFHKI